MTKQHNNVKGKTLEVKRAAETLLFSIAQSQRQIAGITEQSNALVEQVTRAHRDAVAGLEATMAADSKALIALMKKNKAVLFDGTDVVNLTPGSLIREKGDKVSIPKNALQACKDNGFKDVIKSVESLDRPAIEKWSDAKLVLIGAERKPVEEFKYDIKKTVKSE